MKKKNNIKSISELNAKFESLVTEFDRLITERKNANSKKDCNLSAVENLMQEIKCLLNDILSAICDNKKEYERFEKERYKFPDEDAYFINLNYEKKGDELDFLYSSVSEFKKAFKNSILWNNDMEIAEQPSGFEL